MESASWTNGFSKLNSPAHRYLCLRFDRHLAVPPARLKARMDSLLSLPVGLLHPLQHAGLSRRSPDTPSLRRYPVSDRLNLARSPICPSLSATFCQDLKPQGSVGCDVTERSRHAIFLTVGCLSDRHEREWAAPGSGDSCNKLVGFGLANSGPFEILALDLAQKILFRKSRPPGGGDSTSKR
jgi:hypothetical protein